MVNDNTTFVALTSTTLEAPVSTFNAISVTVVASRYEQLKLMERWQCVTGSIKAARTLWSVMD